MIPVPIIIDYDILYSKSTLELIEKVKEKIKDGWQPSGDAFERDSMETLCQKMILYDKDPYFESIK